MMLSGKIVIVTGATGNVGAALMSVLAAGGARLVAVDRDESRVRQHFAELPGSGGHRAVQVGDLAAPGAFDIVVAQAIGAFGRIDCLATTVGAFEMASIESGTADLWERMLQLNLFTALNAIRAVIPSMRAARVGSIVAIGAGAALKAPAQLAAYAASKSALLKLVESTADELKGDGIRVNAVLPGTIDTPVNRKAMPDADHARWVTPTEVATLIAFLLSDLASGVTGAFVPAPGRS
jgi:NAD(P)-dependent dehydrogenase (short-subunit alcohol dehydrogenase family)